MSHICKALMVLIVFGFIFVSFLTEVKTIASDNAEAGNTEVGEEQYAAEKGLTRDMLETIEIEKLAEIIPPEEGAYLQGGTMTPAGLLVAFLPGEPSEGNPLLMLETDNWQTVFTRTEHLSHANDLCYDPTANEILVLPMDSPEIIILDEETLGIKRIIDTPQTYHAIGYDENQNCFAAIYASGKGKEKRLICDILDKTCKRVLRSFSTDTNLVYQGMAVHDSKVYYSCWKREDGDRDHRTIYDDLLQVNDNVIYVYDLEGNLLNAILIKMPEGYNTFEIEAISFLDDRMILLFNENLADENNTLMIGVYQSVMDG